jgi:hypothetical protein
LREETIPFGERKMGVYRAEDGDEVIFEGPDGPFGCIDSVFFRRYALETNLILLKGVFEILRAFVVKNVKLRSMAVMNQGLVSGFPGVAYAGGFAIWNGHCMNGVGVLMVEYEDIMIAAAGGDRKATGLIGIGPENGLRFKEHGAELM